MARSSSGSMTRRRSGTPAESAGARSGSVWVMTFWIRAHAASAQGSDDTQATISSPGTGSRSESRSSEGIDALAASGSVSAR